MPASTPSSTSLDKSRGKIQDRLDLASIALAHVEKIANQSKLPGLGLTVATAKLIVDIVRNARSNVDGALALTERICGLTTAIVTGDKIINNEMKANLDKFNSTLKEMQESLPQITTRAPFNAAVWSFKDAQTLKEHNATVDRACELFQVESHIALHDGNAKQMKLMESILDGVKDIKSKLKEKEIKNENKNENEAKKEKENVNPSQSSSKKTSKNKEKKSSPKPSSPAFKQTQPNSETASAKTSHNKVEDRVNQSQTVLKKMTKTMKTKTTKTREVETNTKTTRHSVIRRPVDVSASR